MSITNGAINVAQIETVANLQDYLKVEFPTGVKSTFQFGCPLPPDYNGGTMTAQFCWFARGVSTNSVVWGVQGLCLSDGTVLDTAYGAAVEVTDANQGTDVNQISAVTAAFTLAGVPAANKSVQFQVYRLGSGADNLAISAMLRYVQIFYTRV